MEQNVESNLFELQVDHIASGYLKEAARWGKFMAIIGFIGCGLMVLIGLFAGSILSSTFGALAANSAIGGTIVSVVYVACALLAFFPTLYLFNFASRMQAALRSNDQDLLNQSFKNLKSCYRFIGILTVIYLSLCVLFIVIAIIGAAIR